MIGAAMRQFENDSRHTFIPILSLHLKSLSSHWVLKNMHEKIAEMLCEQGVLEGFTPFMNYLKKTAYLFSWPIYQENSIDVLDRLAEDARGGVPKEQPEGVE